MCHDGDLIRKTGQLLFSLSLVPGTISQEVCGMRQPHGM